MEKELHAALQLMAEDSRIDLLVRHLAQSRLESLFERIYGAIFGSQIRGLHALANAGGTVPRADAVKFFDDVKIQEAANYAEGVTFDLWVQFLITFELVRVDNASVVITDYGRDFLLYLRSKGLPENKPM